MGNCVMAWRSTQGMVISLQMKVFFEYLKWTNAEPSSKSRYTRDTNTVQRLNGGAPEWSSKPY